MSPAASPGISCQRSHSTIDRQFGVSSFKSNARAEARQFRASAVGQMADVMFIIAAFGGLEEAAACQQPAPLNRLKYSNEENRSKPGRSIRDRQVTGDMRNYRESEI